MLAFIVGRIRERRGAGAPSPGRVMQEMQSLRQLAAAEMTFYYAHPDRVVPYAHPNGEPAIDLVLSSDEAEIEAGYWDGVPPDAHTGRPEVRSFFGRTRRVLVFGGDHLTVCLQAAGGRYDALNKLLDEGEWAGPLLPLI